MLFARDVLKNKNVELMKMEIVA